jgi:hypothetical protein
MSKNNLAKEGILTTIHQWKKKDYHYEWLAMPNFMREWMKAIATRTAHNIGGSRDVWEEITLIAQEVLNEKKP